MALVGVGPGPVEHVFAIRVPLEVQRHGGGEHVAVKQHQVLRLPARVFGGAAGRVQRVQEGVRHQRRGRCLVLE